MKGDCVDWNRKILIHEGKRNVYSLTFKIFLDHCAPPFFTHG